MCPLSLIEATKLLNAVSDFHFESSEKTPKLSIYDKQKEGFVICMKTKLVNEEYHSYLEEIALFLSRGIVKFSRFIQQTKKDSEATCSSVCYSYGCVVFTERAHNFH